MENNKDHLETITEIKQLMERSSRFSSLSGMSGVAAGLTAIAGAIVVSLYLKIGLFEQTRGIMNAGKEQFTTGFTFLFILAIVVFMVALALALYFSSRKAKQKNLIFWDGMAKRIFINLFIFLFTGGIFCLILFYYGNYFLIVPSMLIFYGLALINVSKFTSNEVAQLGIIEICLGIFAAFVTVYPLLIWLIGFGILHLIYGVFVYLKYEK
ncbi:MAG: hypothetical protein ABI550_07785 [Ignavibacteriaceae bacterium]